VSPFDLLFIACFLATVVALVTAALAAIIGRGKQTVRILTTLAACLAAYFVLAIAVDFAKPPRELRIGEPWCVDDWCLTVEKVEHSVAASEANYNVHLQVSSQARRVSQRAKGAWIYLIDDRGRRYSPESDPAAVPLDVLLQPGESVTTSRNFRVPSDVGKLCLITGHGGPYCGPMNILIVGAGSCLFGRPALVRISER